jgi:hypothetical protein
VQTTQAEYLATILAVRAAADIPEPPIPIPGPLLDPPRPQRFYVSRRVVEAAAEAWAAWWRIALAGHVAEVRESNVAIEPPLCGLSPMLRPDPPKFGGLAPAPELRQVAASAWPVVSEWLRGPVWGSAESRRAWEHELMRRAEHDHGASVRNVSLHLSLLPISGPQHWMLTEDPGRHLMHALVSTDVHTDAARHRDWLRQAIGRVV